MNKAIALSVIAILLAGCATQDRQAEREHARVQFEAALGRNIGRDINDLIARAGPPNNYFKMPNGNSVYTYSKSSSYTTPVRVFPGFTSPSQTTYTAVGNTVYAHTSPGISTGSVAYGGNQVTLTCATNFVVAPSGIIISYSYDKQGCLGSD